MSTTVRVRFAPSPTGYLHVGGVRSALFNWLLARHNGGSFVLRIEDTDRSRLQEGAVEQITRSLDLLGLTPDEGPLQGGDVGPYVQSQRLDRYTEHARVLLEAGKLYPCWCSPERLAGLREAAQAAGEAFKYDRYCLEHPQALDQPHVLRFKIPETPAVISWDDEVRGHLEFQTSDLDDFVAVKTDGYPTYQFANVPDDHDMGITHVLRADEWIPSTPKHLLLFAAFGWEAPKYAHLPAILGPDGKKKLSKRDGAISVEEYLADGYLPQAIISFLATLGWNDGTTQEIYTTAELISVFSLGRIQKSPAKFDTERLTWINGKLIREMSLNDLRTVAEPFIREIVGSADIPYQEAVLGLVQERVKRLSELPELIDFFFNDPESIPIGELTKHFDSETAKQHLEAIRKIIATIPAESWSEAQIETAIRLYTGTNELKPGPLFTLIRVSVTGKTAAPGLFETLALLGQVSTLKRLDKVVSLL